MDRDSGHQAHPRSRGENSRSHLRVCAQAGSSPLTRGKRIHLCIVVCTPGLIPAHAGKTSISRAVIGLGPAHPRSRGENSTSDAKPSLGMGSSPLTRGKRTRGNAPGSSPGLIPAHAGKTGGPAESGYAPRAHPRSRGENLLLVLPSGAVQGSSPLTRGKQPHGDSAADRLGLIPAHAGKTSCVIVWRRRVGAHPRSRGENLIWRRPDATAGGSSPLTRGKRAAVSAAPT